MDKEAKICELKDIIEGYLKSRELELVELIYRREGGDLFLRILTDKPEGGISVGECVLLNKDIGAMLDEKGIIEDRYILEVSSPGLDRPLSTRNDFLRNINKEARFFLNEFIDGKLEHAGKISSVGENSVIVDLGAKTLEIPLAKITKAKLVI